MSTLKTINIIHPSGTTNNIVNDASGNITVGNNATVTGGLTVTGTLTGSTGVMNIGSGQIYKDASGNVGIGTSSPSTTLQVNKGSSGTSYAIYADNPAGGGTTNVAGIGFSNGGVLKSSITSAVFNNDWMAFNVGGSGTTERARIDSSGNWYMNSGYGSAAVAYGCRAWVNWQASSSTLRGYGGITSVTRNATGDYTINFSFTMPDTGYNATMMASKSALSSGSSNLMCIAENNVPTTTTLRVYNNPSNNGASTADAVYSCVSIFR